MNWTERPKPKDLTELRALMNSPQWPGFIAARDEYIASQRKDTDEIPPHFEFGGVTYFFDGDRLRYHSGDVIYYREA